MINKKLLRSLILSLIFKAYGFAIDLPDPCEAANNPVNFGEVLAVSHEQKEMIVSYRKMWVKVCGKQMKDIYLSDLLAQAKMIEKEFNKVLDYRNYEKGSTEEEKWKHADLVHQHVQEQYPNFVPAFKGSYIEHTYFQPSLIKFGNKIEFGNDEDKIFFNKFPIDTFKPWIEWTWDYGGCTRYGEFDWVSSLKMSSELSKTLKKSVYQELVSNYEKDLIGNLTTTWDVCTCKDKSSVLSDLNRIKEYMAGKARYREDLSKISTKIDGIKSGKYKVKSQREKHCSGG